jgi:hypothetical protein
MFQPAPTNPGQCVPRFGSCPLNCRNSSKALAVGTAVVLLLLKLQPTTLADERPSTNQTPAATARLSEPPRRGIRFLFVQDTKAAPDLAEPKRPASILGYGDDKPDGKKSYGGSGEMIRFELPEGVSKIKGIRIHGSRYGLPQAPKEDFEIKFLNDKRDETLHSETAPYGSVENLSLIAKLTDRQHSY